MKKMITTLLSALPLIVAAQSFDFDLTKPQPVYSDETGYGYDVLPAPDKKKPTEPFYFSVKVPDGNYRVKVVLGGKKNSNTTVRAEGRRLLMDNIGTKKAKDTQAFEFTVNKRSPQIDEKTRVKIKDREKNYLAWDDRLTLEFNGAMPAVKSIHIEPADVPTLYLCGNSTVVDQNFEPWASWGQMITRWFGPEVAISNHAESGLTARTFIASFRLDKILTTLKKGDYVFVEFGHNDEKEKNAGDGAWYSYSRNLKIFVDRVREKGGNIIFCTPTARRFFDDNGHIKNTHGDYPEAMKAVARRENVPVIDLTKMSTTFYEALGVEGSKHALVHYPANTFKDQPKALADNTHFNPYGAWEIAKMVVMGLKQIQSPLTDHLRPEWQDFDPARPDNYAEFVWHMSGSSNTLKPDGN
jgi:lysophospholipase L1-like esterase